MRPAQGKELAPGLSVMRADLDAATSTSADVQEAQWRAGVNRQAQPGAALHQHAASAAAAAKRVATAMTGDEKEAAERCRADHGMQQNEKDELLLQVKRLLRRR